MDEEWASGGQMLSDSKKVKSGVGKSRTPRFKYRRMIRKVPRTEISGALGGYAFGMIVIFPILAFLTIGAPQAVFGTIGVVALIIALFSRTFFYPLVFVGISLAMIALGFVSIGIAMMIIG